MTPMQAILCMVLEDPGTYLDKAISGGITSDVVRRSDPNGVATWDAICSLSRDDQTIDVVTVGAATGDYAYASGLLMEAPDPGAFNSYVQMVTESAARTRIDELPLIARRALHEHADPREALAVIQSYLADVDMSIHGAAGFVSSTDLFMDLCEGLESGEYDVSGSTTGIVSLDRYLGGMFPGRFYILAGRPGLGKTSMALQIVRHQAIDLGAKTAIISLEMSNEELGLRMLSGMIGVDEQRIRRRRLTPEQWRLVAAGSKALGQAEIHMDDRVSFDVSAMESRVRKMHQDIGGLDLLVVDYIQLMSAGGRGRNRQEEVSAISRSLKMLAKTIGCPVIGLSQLSRNGAEGRPSLQDLRESGSLEQDADFVGMLYAEGPEKHLFIPKNRFGEPGKDITLGWTAETTTFN